MEVNKTNQDMSRRETSPQPNPGAFQVHDEEEFAKQIKKEWTVRDINKRCLEVQSKKVFFKKGKVVNCIKCC